MNGQHGQPIILDVANTMELKSKLGSYINKNSYKGMQEFLDSYDAVCRSLRRIR